MKRIGALLSGLSLLTLALIIVLDKIAEPLFSVANNPTYSTSLFAYVLVGIVFLLGVILMFVKE